MEIQVQYLQTQKCSSDFSRIAENIMGHSLNISLPYSTGSTPEELFNTAETVKKLGEAVALICQHTADLTHSASLQFQAADNAASQLYAG